MPCVPKIGAPPHQKILDPLLLKITESIFSAECLCYCADVKYLFVKLRTCVVTVYCY